MSTVIAIFVKTPSLSPVKTRLAEGIGKEKALEFYQLSLQCVQETVKSADISAYWAIAEENGLADPLWQDLTALWTGEGNLGERQHHIYESLLQKHNRVILIGADAPQLSKNILEQAILKLDTHDFVIGPARDGGYYLFGGKVSTQQKIWTSIPWSTSITRERLETGLPSIPARLQVLTDVDTKNDLKFITQEMPQNRNAQQKQLIEWIENYERPVSLHG
ncbi:MAG: TIGR04282 family arsenosugar biosynthesis glycosyltransferase [Alphaproteobacteria bacterium]|nr:TIGR04282 family arsenosugar biosynthesis glycosyltransferase [Alphaproteobacteria bacterium]